MAHYIACIFACFLCLSSLSMGEPGILSSLIRRFSGGIPDWSSFIPSSGKSQDSSPGKSPDSSPGKSSGAFPDWSSFIPSAGKSSDASPGKSSLPIISGGGHKSKTRKSTTRKPRRKGRKHSEVTPVPTDRRR